MTSNDSPLEALSDRVRRLERANRRLFGIVVLLLASAFLQTFWHFLPTPGTVVARGFVLKGATGAPRAELSLWADGTPALRLNNDTGEARALFALRRDGNLNLRLSDSSFTNRLEFGVGPDGLPRIALSGNDGHSRANLWVDRDNVAHLDVSNAR